MSETTYVVAGIAGATINIIGFVPYIRDIFRHKTEPERAMWWIYTALFLLLFAAQLNAGAHWLLLVTGVYILNSAVIAILSLRYGYGSLHKRDAISLIIAAIGLLLWLLTKQPLLAILVVILVDIAGFWLTLLKVWHAPRSETLVSWQLAFVAAVISIFSIKTLKFDLVIYPLYAVAGEAFLIGEIMYRRKKVQHDLKDF